MNDRITDLQTVRNFFSKAQRTSFGFLDVKEKKLPYVALHFKPVEAKQAHTVLHQLSKITDEEKFKLFINENGGDYLSVSFLWESRGIIFSSSPDRYNKRECREFQVNAFYGDVVKLFFYLDDEEHLSTMATNIKADGLDCIYYEYLP